MPGETLLAARCRARRELWIRAAGIGPPRGRESAWMRVLALVPPRSPQSFTAVELANPEVKIAGDALK